MSGEEYMVLALGGLLIMVGLAFKLSAVPFHFWCPDAFQGARTEVTTWLSVASKAAGLLLLMRLVHAFAGAHSDNPLVATPLTSFAWVIGIVAAVTCTVGNFAAYMQSSVKRLLAYSSIAHAGYMMMAAAVLVHPAGMNGYAPISAILAYVGIYLFMNLGAFGVTALVQLRSGGDDSLGAFNGLMRRSPLLAVPMLLCLVSLIGLPPLAGFLAKWWLLYALGAADNSLCWALIVVAVINTLISLWFYMRVVVAMMLKDDGKPALDVPIGGAALVNACGVLLIALLVFQQPLKSRADRYAQNLFQATPDTTVAMGDATADETSPQQVRGDRHGG